MATPNRTYLSNGQMLESLPLSARVSRTVDNIYTFLGLYFVSLFSMGFFKRLKQFLKPDTKTGRTVNTGNGTAKNDGDRGRRESAGVRELPVRRDFVEKMHVYKPAVDGAKGPGPSKIVTKKVEIPDMEDYAKKWEASGQVPCWIHHMGVCGCEPGQTWCEPDTK